MESFLVLKSSYFLFLSAAFLVFESIIKTYSSPADSGSTFSLSVANLTFLTS